MEQSEIDGRLFALDKDGRVEINKVWVKVIPALNFLITRDKDQYKKKAFQDFTYIYLRYAYDSPIENYSKLEKDDAALSMSGLTPGQVASDKGLWSAIEAFTEWQDKRSVSLRTLRSFKASIDSTVDYVERIDLTDRTDSGAKVHSPKDIQVVIQDMPKTLKAMKELEALVKQELSGDSGLRGDAVKGEEEDPD